MLVWLDMANSPHPMLLGPLADELGRAGHDVWVTTRDHAQTVDLTREHWPDAAVVGGPSPSSRAGKVRRLTGRMTALRRLAGERRPQVAVSLNSYAQVIAARSLGIPTVTMMDYEFQPANHISFRLASRVVVPAAFPQERLRHYGVRSDARVRRFDGYKEELYLDRDAGSGDDGWGTPAGSGDAVRCLFRPPPHGAMYHRDGNSQFDELVIRASGRSDTSVLVLPRFPEQRDQYGSLPRVRVADRTVDGLRTLRGADVFIGAGGTMCREAALLGVPAYTVFAGQIAAVDERLIAAGGLRDLRAAELDVERWAKRDAGESRRDVEQLHARADTLRRWLVSVIEDAAGDPGRRR
jgi:predicted glycosyltransferase